MSTPITPEWLSSIGIYPKDGNKPERYEHTVRIRGADDSGWKMSSEHDTPGDEIANLVVAYAEEEYGDAVGIYIETYTITNLNTVECIYLGLRHTREEVLDLCRALKAWGVKYDVDP